MKTVLKLTAIAAVLACGAMSSQFTLAQPSQSGVQRGIATEQRQLAPFSAIELAGPYHVVVRAGGRQAVTLSGERKQIDEVETVVRGDTLVVRAVRRNDFGFHFGRRRETVTVTIDAASLKSLRMSGSGDVDLDQVSGEAFTLVNTGPGDLHAGGAVRQLAVESSGSGDLDLHLLKAADVRLTMRGPGDVQLAGTATALTAEVRGSGDLKVRDLQARSVRLRMHGPGNVELDGSAAELDAELHGSGDLEGGRLKVNKASVRSRGPGGATLSNVTDTLDAEVRGSGGLTATLSGTSARVTMDGPGDVRLEGSVAHMNARLSGSGSLEGRHLAVNQADIVVRGPGDAAVNLVGPHDSRRGERGRLLLVDRNGPRNSAD